MLFNYRSSKCLSSTRIRMTLTGSDKRGLRPSMGCDLWCYNIVTYFNKDILTSIIQVQYNNNRMRHILYNSTTLSSTYKLCIVMLSWTYILMYYCTQVPPQGRSGMRRQYFHWILGAHEHQHDSVIVLEHN